MNSRTGIRRYALNRSVLMLYVLVGVLIAALKLAAFLAESHHHLLERYLLPVIGVALPSGIETPMVAVVLMSVLCVAVGLLTSVRALVLMPVVLLASEVALLAPELGFAGGGIFGFTLVQATIVIFSIIGAFVLMEQNGFWQIRSSRVIQWLKLAAAIALANTGAFYFFKHAPQVGEQQVLFALYLGAHFAAGIVLAFIAEKGQGLVQAATKRDELAGKAVGLEAQVAELNQALKLRVGERDQARTERDSFKGANAELEKQVKDLKVRLGDVLPEAPPLRAVGGGGGPGSAH